jgi:hypothetical protein
LLQLPEEMNFWVRGGVVEKIGDVGARTDQQLEAGHDVVPVSATRHQWPMQPEHSVAASAVRCISAYLIKELRFDVAMTTR